MQYIDHEYFAFRRNFWNLSVAAQVAGGAAIRAGHLTAPRRQG
jgi:hypothetical protein